MPTDMKVITYHLPDCNFCKGPSELPPLQPSNKMSSAAVMTSSLPRIAPPSTPIHMTKVPSPPVSSKKATTAHIKESTTSNLRNKSAPANLSKTLLTSSDYGSHHYQYRDNPSYSVYPPFITEQQTASRVPPRVNPLQPPPPKRYTTSLETIEPHWHNEKRRNVMQQREWYRYHGTWSKAFYGSPAEKEAYRRKTRETLKQQMSDYWSSKHRTWEKNSKESQVSIDYDNECLRRDALDHREKTVYLMQYRDDNKSIMEQLWAKNNYKKKVDKDYEQEILRYTPINWSHTLK